MSDLKAGTTIGGQIAWHGGNLDVLPSGNSLFFKSFKVYSENDKPTRADVGLGSVQDFGIATQAQAEAGTSNSVYMTALRSKQQLDTHATLTNNPHGVTKAQVQLGNVENYGIASTSEASEGTVNNKYMTPLRNQDHFLSKTTSVTRALLLDANEAAIRSRLNVAEIGIGDGQVRTNSDLDGRYALLSRTMTAGDGLQGGGTLAGSRTFAVDSTVARYGTSNGQVRTNTQNDRRFAQLDASNWGSSGLGGYGYGAVGYSIVGGDVHTAVSQFGYVSTTAENSFSNNRSAIIANTGARNFAIGARGRSLQFRTWGGDSADGLYEVAIDGTGNVQVRNNSQLDARYSQTDTTYSAGTGLSLTGTTFSVNYGTTAGTAAQGNDSRLSNSREWTASTVTQAEAEAGTATTRRAWTAQRVRQNVAAYTDAFNSSGNYASLRARGTTAADVGAYTSSQSNDLFVLKAIEISSDFPATIDGGFKGWRNGSSSSTQIGGFPVGISTVDTSANAGWIMATDIRGGQPMSYQVYRNGWQERRVLWDDQTFNPSDYVPASRTIGISTGAGLTGGATQNLGANRTFSISVDNSVLRTVGNQSKSGNMTFNDYITINDTALITIGRAGSAETYDFGWQMNSNAATWYADNTRSSSGWAFRRKAGSAFANMATLDQSGNFTAAGIVTGSTVRGSDPILKDVLYTKRLSLNEICTLQSVVFKWKYGALKGQISYGVLADEVERIAPELIRYEEATYQEVDGVEEVYVPAHRVVDYDGLNALMATSLAYHLNNKWYRRLYRWVKGLF